MRKLLLLFLLLLVLIGCDSKTNLTEPTDIKTEEVLETVPTDQEPTVPTQPIDEEPTTPVEEGTLPDEEVSTISFPDSKLEINKNGQNQTYYLWTSDNKLYIVENPIGLKTFNGYVKLDELAHDIDFSTSLDFGVTIDILLFIFEDLVDYLKLHSGTSETGEYTFSGEELVALVKLFVPEENLSEEFIDVLKTIGENANVSIKFEDGLLVSMKCNYYENFAVCYFTYNERQLSQVNATIDWEQTVTNPTNPEEHLTYQIDGTCSVLLSETSLTINLDTNLKTSSTNPELCQEADYDLLLTAPENNISFNGNIHGISFTGNLLIEDNLKLNLSLSHLEDSYTVKFETKVIIPKTVKNEIVMATSTDIGGLYQKIIESISKEFDWEHLI